MARGRPTKKPRLAKFEPASQSEQVEYQRHHIYRALEHGNISVESNFIEVLPSNINDSKTPSDPSEDSWQEPETSSFDILIEPTTVDHNTNDPRKKQAPSVSMIYPCITS